DAQLQRRRGDQRPQVAGPQPGLYPLAALAGQAPVVGGDLALAQPLPQLVGDPLGPPAGVVEHQRGGGRVGEAWPWARPPPRPWGAPLASPAELTNTSVVRCSATWPAIRSRISAICSPVATAPSSSSGSSRARSSWRRCPESTIAQRGEPSGADRSCPAPTSSRATVSMGRWVADSPIRWTGPALMSSSRSRDCARCEPRLVPGAAW